MWLNDTSELIRELKKRNVRTVALQLPEGLKRKGAGIARVLKEAGFSVIISGDPCYGACDLAFDALDSADVLVHIGHAPVDSHRNVIFEPYWVDFDLHVLKNALPLLKGPVIGLVTTVQHTHLISDMRRWMEENGISVRIARGGSRTPLTGQVLGCSFAAARNANADEILVVATGLFHATGVALATGRRVIALDPFTGAVQEVSGDALMRQRFAAIEKARGAATIGIIVSTKSGQRRMDLAEKLVSLDLRATIVLIREVLPDELLNLGYDAYVNTACPRLAYDDRKRFPVPVLSPQEFEILCGVREWEDYAIDEIA
ncbi:MAG: 2-(3-amino-3-carboxypropyl)histidine synthase [Methanoregula sp. PtaU1.Bin051]|nr:MAG: 2-(3-amino-3-carboxypropyl)histidine synthase [Methanoregula sp. PtaU1.Bin051]